VGKKNDGKQQHEIVEKRNMTGEGRTKALNALCKKENDPQSDKKMKKKETTHYRLRWCHWKGRGEPCFSRWEGDQNKNAAERGRAKSKEKENLTSITTMKEKGGRNVSGK